MSDILKDIKEIMQTASDVHFENFLDLQLTSDVDPKFIEGIRKSDYFKGLFGQGFNAGYADGFAHGRKYKGK